MPPCVLSVAVDGFWFAPLFKSVQVLLLSVLSCGQSVSLPVYMLYSLLLLVTFISFIFLSMVSRSDMRDNITQDVVLSYGRDTSTLFHFISFHKHGFPMSVNRHTYQDCLLWFVQKLKERKCYRNSIIMQDGATPHTVKSTRFLLNKLFPNISQ